MNVAQVAPASPERTLGESALQTVEAAFFRAPDARLNFLGRVVQTGVRFLGPALLGLMVLSIRGRVRR